MQLTEREFNVLSDTDFLLTKVQVISKMEQLLSDTRSELRKVVGNEQFLFPNDADKVAGKISKGENYQGLPYLVLDYPAYFTKADIFVFRTMFWWGNFFSCTLHLQGDSLNQYRGKLIAHLGTLKEQDEIYISVGENPWQYHYNTDNYKLISTIDETHIINARFIKISIKIPLSDWSEVPEQTTSFLKMVLKVLS